MSTGIVQLVATGVQDTYLSGNPEISFFRSSFKRYTHFASAVERQIIQGNPAPGSMSTVRFEKKGDLLSSVYLSSNDVNNTTNVNANWLSLISRIDLVIGGQVIDSHDAIYSSNIEPVIGSQTFGTSYHVNQPILGFYPLKFFFCKDWATALPLVSLQYHDVELRIYWGTTIPDPQIGCWARYIYLDEAERGFFAKKSHDMLITQVTRTLVAPVAQFEFALAQPTKLIAFESNSYTYQYNQSPANASALKMSMVINGTEIGEARTLYHWCDINQYYLSPFAFKPQVNVGSSNVAVIPFCLDTAKTQPTGSLNFSRIDTFRLRTPSTTTVQNLTRNGAGSYFYAIGYNILRIQNGQAGVLYAS